MEGVYDYGDPVGRQVVGELITTGGTMTGVANWNVSGFARRQVWLFRTKEGG